MMHVLNYNMIAPLVRPDHVFLLATSAVMEGDSFASLSYYSSSVAWA